MGIFSYVLVFYIGFVLGLYIMEFLDLKYHFNTYRSSPFNFILTILLSPILFPFQLIKFILK